MDTNSNQKRLYTLRTIRQLLEPLGYQEERIMYVYYFLNGKIDEAEEYLEIINNEQEYIKKRLSNDNI